jgi:hypothetical protein
MSQATSSRSILLPPSSSSSLSSTAMPSGSNTKPSWRLLTHGEVKKIMSGSNVNSANPSTSSGSGSGYHHHHSHSQDDEHENGIHTHTHNHNHKHNHNHSHARLNSTSTSALPLPLPLPMHSLGLDTTPLSTPTNDLEGEGDPLGSGLRGSSGAEAGSAILNSTSTSTSTENTLNLNSTSLGGDSLQIQQPSTTVAGTGPSRGESSRTLCVRHQSMADQGINGMLQQVSLGYGLGLASCFGMLSCLPHSHLSISRPELTVHRSLILLSLARPSRSPTLAQSLDALPLSERAAITSLWSTFSSSPHPKRKIILEGILTMCCFSQLSHLSESLSQIIRVDPFSLFPKEVSLKVLGFLDAISLGKAAQVSRGWRELADDDLLWRRMCGQHIERKCTRCGWGLPLLERRRLRMEEQGKDQLHHQHQHQQSGEHHGQHDGHGHHEHSMLELRPIANPLGSGSNSASELRGEKRTAAHDPETQEDTGTSNSALVTLPSVKRRRVDAEECSGSMNRMETSSDSEVSEFGSRAGMVEVPSASGRFMVASTSTSKAMAVPMTTTLPGMTTRSGSTLSVPLPSPRPARRKPWKHVYCERLMVERNWRKGRPVERILKGHTNGVMCLQVQHNLSTPSYPVLITGSYDKTIKVWNLDTGEVVRTLLGHTRSVRALQFDQAMLVTGSSDKTLRVWNWRTGECLRVLEGHTQGVSCLHYDRNTLASGSADSTIKVSCRSGFEFRQSVSVADNR